MKILVAIIAYNEEKNIESVIKELLSLKYDVDLILIDNSSTDKTCQLAESLGVNFISHCINTGGAMGTVTSYFAYASKNNYDVVCQFDGDGQHIATELEKIIEPITTDKADYVIGSRFLTKRGFQSYFFRRVGIKLFSVCNSAIINKKITDSTSGFRAYGKNVIDFFGKKWKHEIHDVNQLLLLSSFWGARIEEVPVEMRARIYGKSEYNLINSISFPVKGIINILGCLLQRNQIIDLRGQNGN